MKSYLKRMTKKQIFWLTTGASAIFAALISLSVGLRQSIWFDEAYSILISKQPVSEILHLTSLDTHPPLYYIMLNFVGEASNWNVVWLRLLSVLALAVSIVVMSLLVRRLFGLRAALLTAVILALSPLLLRYGYEIRMYSLASLIGVVATYVLVRGVDEPKRKLWWMIYAVLVALGMMTLYYMAFLWLAHVVWLVWAELRLSRQAWRKWFRLPWLWSYVGALVLFLPWLPIFLRQTSNGALAPIGQQMNAENLFGVFSFNILFQPLWQLNVFYSLIFIAVLIVVIIALVSTWKSALQADRIWLGLLISYFAVPIVILILMSFSKSMYVERYLSHVAIGLMTLIAISLAFWTGKKSRHSRIGLMIFGVALLFGCFQMIGQGNFNFQRMSRPNIAQISEFITATCRDDGVVVAADPYVAIEMMAYVPRSCPIYFYSDSDKLGGGYAPLNASPFQLRNQNINLPYARTYYVYYDKPNLKISGQPTVTISSDNLRLTLYR